MSTLSTTNVKNPSSGSNNVVLGSDGSATIATLNSTTVTATNITGTTIQGIIKQATAVASTSGTSIDFTGIPSWVKRITVMFNGVSTNGTNSLQVQLGSGSIQTTGYVSSANSTVSSTTGLLATSGAAAANNYQGLMTISLLSSNAWVSSCVLSRNDAFTFWAGGAVTLSGTLDRLRLTTVNGTDSFDAGSVNILYEG